MPADKKQCAYEECDTYFYGGKRAMYCRSKCGTYQRRLKAKRDKAALEDNKLAEVK